MRWAIGWPFLILSLFLTEPFREQVLALQTIICTFFGKGYTFQLLTLIFVISFFIETQMHDNITVQILHHCIVLCTVIVQYIDNKHRYFCWCLLLWSVRWLGSVNIYDQPIRTSIKCIVLVLVLKGRWRPALERPLSEEFKWCWVLFVHEFVCLLLPVQLLYEVYVCKTNKEMNQILP